MEHRVKSDIFIIGSQCGCEGSCPDGLTPGQPSHSSVLKRPSCGSTSRGGTVGSLGGEYRREHLGQRFDSILTGHSIQTVEILIKE